MKHYSRSESQAKPPIAGLDELWFPTAATVLRHIGKPVDEHFYRRVLDSVPTHFEAVSDRIADHDYWRVLVRRPGPGFVALSPVPDLPPATTARPTVCVMNYAARRECSPAQSASQARDPAE